MVMFLNCFISIYSSFFREVFSKIVLHIAKLYLKNLDQNPSPLKGLKDSIHSAGTDTGRGPLIIC